MKRKIACGTFWLLFYIDLFVLSVMLNALFAVSSDINTGHILVLLILFALLIGGTIILYRIYDPFREKYSVAHETPLLYHKILCYIGLPLGILMTVASICNTFTAKDFPANSFYWIDLFFLFASLIAACVCFAGLKKFKTYAWHARMIGILLDILYDLAVVVCRIIFAPFLLSDSLISLIVTVYVSAMIALYYYKRKNLFFIPQLAEVDIVPTATNTDTESADKNAVEAPANFSLSPVDTIVEEPTSGEWRVPASDLALNKDVQATLPHAVQADTTNTSCNTNAPIPTASIPNTKRKFCSRCGNEIDPNTKKCTGCGKQYFKGISWKVAVLIGLLVVSCALNIFQYISELKQPAAHMGNGRPAIVQNVAVRTISLDYWEAKLALINWETGEATEQTMIEIMNEYGAEQGGGKLYVIERGEFVEEIDEWCFSPNRKVGDYEIIENAYGYTICYISGFNK